MYQILYTREGRQVDEILRQPTVLIVCSEQCWTDFSKELSLFKSMSLARKNKSQTFWSETMKSVMCSRYEVYSAVQHIFHMNLSSQLRQIMSRGANRGELMCLIISDFRLAVLGITPTETDLESTKLEILNLAENEQDVKSALCIEIPVTDVTPSALIQKVVPV